MRSRQCRRKSGTEEEGGQKDESGAVAGKASKAKIGRVQRSGAIAGWLRLPVSGAGSEWETGNSSEPVGLTQQRQCSQPTPSLMVQTTGAEETTAATGQEGTPEPSISTRLRKRATTCFMASKLTRATGKSYFFLSSFSSFLRNFFGSLSKSFLQDLQHILISWPSCTKM
jgi:hypothetical protein